MKRPTPGPAVFFSGCVVCSAVFQDVAKAPEACRVFGDAIDWIPSGGPAAMWWPARCVMVMFFLVIRLPLCRTRTQRVLPFCHKKLRFPCVQGYRVLWARQYRVASSEPSVRA